MSRIKVLQKHIWHVLKKMDDYYDRAEGIAHLHGVAMAAAMIAKGRGQDPELAVMAALLHDVYAYKSGSYKDHAHLGAEYARKTLDRLAITDEKETDIICDAIYHHSDKDVIDSPLAEVLKDADVMHHTLNDPTKEIKPHEKERYLNLCEEFGMEER